MFSINQLRVIRYICLQQADQRGEKKETVNEATVLRDVADTALKHLKHHESIYGITDEDDIFGEDHVSYIYGKLAAQAEANDEICKLKLELASAKAQIKDAMQVIEETNKQKAG